MKEYRHSRFDEEILDAMAAYNTTKSAKEQFALIDARVISMIHSYAYSNKQFFASNVYLAGKCLATQSTIQKSINRLIAHKFITKEIRCVDGHKKRIITYNDAVVEAFKTKYEKCIIP